jgi:hypothetical protein
MSSRSSGRRSSSSVKPRPPPPKLPCEETDEERAKHVQEEVKAHFRKTSPPPEKTPDEVAAEIALAKTLTRPAPSLPSDFERTIKKKFAESVRDKGKTAVSDPPKEWQRWKFELGKPLVSPYQERKLSTQLRRLHQWYLKYVRATGAEMFPIQFKKDLLHHEKDKEIKGQFKSFQVFFEDLYHLYQRDAVDIAMIRLWTL